jgi:Uncharacterized protein conserved in bacteria (DUF2255).
MKPKSRFTQDVLATIHKDRILGIRAGSDSDHRIIGIWAVVVKGGVFVRSYQMRPGGWWKTFLEDPLEKYSSPGANAESKSVRCWREVRR